MRAIDAGMRTVDDDKHLGRKIGTAAIEQHARHLHIGDLIRMLCPKEMEASQPMLAVDHEIFALRLTEMTGGFRLSRPLRPQRLVREDQDGFGNHGVRHRRDRKSTRLNSSHGYISYA